MNFAKFDGPPDPVAARLFGDGKTNILFVGRVIPNKKFEDLLKTFAFYKTHFNRDARLVLAGEHRGQERYLAALQDLVERLRLTDVHFSNHIEFPELLALYKTAHVYLSMSEHEGFGVPLLEAFHNRIPTFGFAGGAVEETMNGGGVVLTRKDFLRTAAAIDRVVTDAGLRARIVAGQLRALEAYSRANVSRILLEHVERIGRG
jgi:glycosyltransferase involved in cell wall biosynthesis